MLRYEILMLTVPEITQDETKSLESQLDNIIKKAKGALISFERWGKYKLAYPVKKNDYGIYFLARLEMEQTTSVINDIRTLFSVKLNDIIMRDMVSKLDVKQSLAYQRPQSLEEAPTGNVDTFLKKHKSERFLSQTGGIAQGLEAASTSELLQDKDKAVGNNNQE